MMNDERTNQALHPSDGQVHLQNKLSSRRWVNANVRRTIDRSCSGPSINRKEKQ